MATIPGRPTSPTWQNYVNSRVGRHTPFGYGGLPNGGVSTSGRGSSGNGNGSDPGPMGFLSKVVDIISQPMYALTEIATEIGSGDTPDSFKDWLHLGSGNSKITWSDLLNGRAEDKYREANEVKDPMRLHEYTQEQAFMKDAPGWAKGVVGFGADVLLDPMTYTGAGLVAKGVKGLTAGAGKAAARETLSAGARAAAAKVATNPYLGRVAEKGIIGDALSTAKNAAITRPMRAAKTAALEAQGIAPSGLRSAAQDRVAEAATRGGRLYGGLQRVQSKLTGTADELYPRLLGNEAPNAATVNTRAAANAAMRTGARTEPNAASAAPVPDSGPPAGVSERAAAAEQAQKRSVAEELLAKQDETQSTVQKQVKDAIDERAHQMPDPELSATGTPTVVETASGVRVKKPVYQMVDRETGEVLQTFRSKAAYDKWVNREAKYHAVQFLRQNADELGVADTLRANDLIKQGKQPVVARAETGRAIKATSTSPKSHPKFVQANKAGEVTDHADQLVAQLREGLWQKGTRIDPGGLDVDVNYRQLVDPKKGIDEDIVLKSVSRLMPKTLSDSNLLAKIPLEKRARATADILRGAIADHGVAKVTREILQQTEDMWGAATKQAATNEQIAAALRHFGIDKAEVIATTGKNAGRPSRAKATKLIREAINDEKQRIERVINRHVSVSDVPDTKIRGWFKQDETGEWSAKWSQIMDEKHVDYLLSLDTYEDFEKAARAAASMSRRRFDEAISGVSRYPGGNPKSIAELTTRKYRYVDPETGELMTGTESLVDLMSYAIRTGDTFNYGGFEDIQLGFKPHFGDDLRKQIKNAMDDVAAAEPHAQITDVMSNSDEVAEALEDASKSEALREQIAARNAFYREGGELTPELWEDIKKSVDNQRPDWNWTTDKTKARRNSPTPGEGMARHENTWNGPAQSHLFLEVADRHSKAFSALDPMPTRPVKDGPREVQAAWDAWMRRRSNYLMDHVVDDMAKADRYFMAQGIDIHPQLSSSYAGSPLGLGQVLEIMKNFPDGLIAKGDLHPREFLRNYVFRWYGEGRGGFLVGPQQVGEIANNIAAIARNRLPNGQINLETLTELTEAWQNVNLINFLDYEHALDSSPIQRSLFRALTDAEGQTTAEGLVRSATKKGGVQPVKPGNPLARSERRLEDVQRIFEHPYFVSAVVETVQKNTATLGVNFSYQVGKKAGDLLAPIQAAYFNAKAPLSELARSFKAVDDAAKAGASREWKSLYVGPFGRNRPRGPLNGGSPAVDRAAAKAAMDVVNGEMITDPVARASLDGAIAQGGETAAKRTVDAKGMNAQAHTAQRHSDNVANEAVQQAMDAGVLEPDDLIEVSMGSRIFDMVDKGLRHMNRSYADATIHSAQQVAGNIGSVLQRTFRHNLNDLHHAITREIAGSSVTHREYAQNLLRAIKETPPGGILRGATDAETALLNQMSDMINQVFSTDPRSLMGVWAREGFDIVDLNHLLSSKRYGEGRFLIDTMNNVKKVNGIETLQDLDAVWRSWDIDDPLEWLSLMQDLTVNMSTKVGSAREFYQLARKANMLSGKPRPGWVKVSRNTVYSDLHIKGRGKVYSTTTKYLPMNGKRELYMSPELFGQMKRMDEMIARIDDDLMNTRELTRLYDNVISVFKSGMTIWRPAHHVRTLIGDTTLAHFASGLRDPAYFYKSLRISQAVKGLRDVGAKGNFRAQQTAWDALASLHGLREGIESMPKGFQTAVAGTLKLDTVTEPITFIRVGGKRRAGRWVSQGTKKELTPNDVARLAMDNGILPDFNVQEDIIGLTRKGGRAANGGPLRLMHGRNRERLGNFVEGRDDFVRLAHFTHLLENGINHKGWPATMSFDDVVKRAAAQVRKVHPDGSDLTPFERKYMRRVFTFYSWVRKAIPLVVENTLKHPGRAMAFPKAAYSMGVAAGLDLESLSEPFPDDQMFPEFVSDTMIGFLPRTSDGRYYTFNLGISNVDIYNDWFSGMEGGGRYDKPGPLDDAADLTGGFLQEMLSMTTPLGQIPIALLTGSDPDTGIKVNDRAELLESTIPGLADIARITGYSPLGTALSPFDGAGPRLDPLYQVSKGNRGAIGGEEGWSPEYLANYFTGARITDVSKDSYQNLAEIERRDRVAAVKRAENAKG